MICYKDQAFCNSDCVNSKCFRFFSDFHKSTAEYLSLPVSFDNFSTDCPDYIPAETTDAS